MRQSSYILRRGTCISHFALAPKLHFARAFSKKIHQRNVQPETTRPIEFTPLEQKRKLILTQKRLQSYSHSTCAIRVVSVASITSG